MDAFKLKTIFQRDRPRFVSFVALQCIIAACDGKLMGLRAGRPESLSTQTESETSSGPGQREAALPSAYDIHRLRVINGVCVRECGSGGGGGGGVGGGGSGLVHILRVGSRPHRCCILRDRQRQTDDARETANES